MICIIVTSFGDLLRNKAEKIETFFALFVVNIVRSSEILAIVATPLFGCNLLHLLEHFGERKLMLLDVVVSGLNEF